MSAGGRAWTDGETARYGAYFTTIRRVGPPDRHPPGGSGEVRRRPLWAWTLCRGDTQENLGYEEHGVSWNYATALADSDAALERADPRSVAATTAWSRQRAS
jgi:hypothetical protein